jgi:hypothetical protein
VSKTDVGMFQHSPKLIGRIVPLLALTALNTRFPTLALKLNENQDF